MTAPPSRSRWLRAVGVVAITGAITLAAACSDQDTVDTVPPPWPTRTVTPEGPDSVPRSTAEPSSTSIRGRSPTSTTTTTTKSPLPTETTTETTSGQP